MRNLTILWLDDVRNPEKYLYKQNNSKTFARNKSFYDQLMSKYNVEFIWVKNFDEFTKYIISNGVPEFVSFDHDLGAGMQKGLDCAKWLINYCKENNLAMPKTFVHSANPNGQREINAVLNSDMINEEGRKFKNLISTAQLIKQLRQRGYENEYSERAIYTLFEKYGIKPKTQRGGKSYFNKKNACDCIERHIFELYQIAERFRNMNNEYDDSFEDDDETVGYGRNDMSAVSRELLANDGVFGADENELYATNENRKIINISENQFRLFEVTQKPVLKININEEQYKRLFENLDDEGFSMSFNKLGDGKYDVNNPSSIEFIPNKKGGYSDTSIFKDGTKEFNIRLQHLPKCNLDSINLYFIKNMNINKAIKHGVNVAGNKINVGDEEKQNSIEYFKKRSAYYISRILSKMGVYPDLFTSPQSSSDFNKDMLMLLNRYYPKGDITVMPNSMKKDVRNMTLNIRVAKEIGLTDEQIAMYQAKLTKYKKDEDIRGYRKRIEQLKQEIASLMTGKRGRPSSEVSNRKKQIDAYNTLIQTNRSRGKDSTVNADGSIKSFQIKSFDDKQRKILDNLFVFNDDQYPSKNYNGKEYQQYLKFNNKVVVVFDDNISSGATLDMMCNELLKYNPKKIIPITLGQIPLTAYSNSERGELEKRA